MHDKVSDHISYLEATRSSCKIANVPSPFALENMKLLAENVFEPLRKHFGSPIRINSFYRCHAVNTVVGGSASSQHMCGTVSGHKEAAIDISSMTGRPSNADLFNWLREHVEFDQLIWEFGSDIEPDWIHVSYRPGNNRKRCLKSYKTAGRTFYKIKE